MIVAENVYVPLVTCPDSDLLVRVTRDLCPCVGYREVADKLQVFSCSNSSVKQLQFGADGSIVELNTTVGCSRC